MELSSDYYPFREVNGKDADLIFRELNTNETYRQIKDGTWKEVFVNIFGIMLSEMPDVRAVANRILHDGMAKKGVKVDPEKVYMNTFGSSMYVYGSGVYHKEDSLIESYRLTDAALMNYFYANYADDWDVLGLYTSIGIYNVGKEGRYEPSQPSFGKGWGPTSAVCTANVPADVLYYSDLHTAYVAEYNNFWGKYNNEYRDMIADLFLGAAVQQYKAKLLSELGFNIVRKVYGKQAGVKTYFFNVATYNATDVIVMVTTDGPKDHTVLYIPGALTPFIEFENFTQMRKWLMNNLADPVAKTAFLKHFSIYLRQDGVTYSGVDTYINKMLSNEWSPQDYIMQKPYLLPYDKVFDAIRDRIKGVMLDDANREINSNSEVFSDYIINFFETFISHLFFMDMLMPEIGIPINMALSATVLGLSANLIVNGDTLSKRLDGVGSLVSSSVYIVLNLVPVLIGVGLAYKGFRRPNAQIPAHADEATVMQRRFLLESQEALNAIQPGEKPYVVHTWDGRSISLVRLADGHKPLSVISNIGGNAYVRLNPMTLEELAGEGMVFEMLALPSNKRIYVSNSRLLGGAPYSPFESVFEEVWPVEVLKKKADKLGLSDSKYVTIKEKLAKMHASVDFDTKQQIAHELYFLLRDYEETYPRALRKSVLTELKIQLREALYDDEVEFMGKALLGEKENFHHTVSSKIYMISISERLGELRPGITEAMIKFAKADPVLSINKLSTEFLGDIPTGLPFTVKYAIDDLTSFNNLQLQYFNNAVYKDATVAVTSNKEAFIYSLKESQRIGMLPNCWLPEDGNVLYIGHTFDEIERTVTIYSCSPETRYGAHPFMVLNMLKGLLSDNGSNEMLKMFGTEEYFNALVSKRVTYMKDAYQLSAYSLDYKYDRDVDAIFNGKFDSSLSEQERLGMLMDKTDGTIFRNEPRDIEYLNRKLDFFIGKGVTHIGLTDFFADVEQTQIDDFLKDGIMTTNMGATILSLDKGDPNGPLYRLMMSAYRKGLKVVALGESDIVPKHVMSPYANIYVKSLANRNAIQLLKDKKYVVVAHSLLANTEVGLREGVPGLAQQLKAPAVYTNNPELGLNFSPEIKNKRAGMYIQLPYWVSIAPPEGRFMGWKKYGDGFHFVSPAQREALVFGRITEDLEGFKKEFYEIREEALKHQKAQIGMCDKVAAKVQGVLSSMGKRVGYGRTLAWWTKDTDGSLINNVHTAPTVFIRDQEYVVDASHLQFRHELNDEGVMILPPDDWADEILNRVKASNAFMANRSIYGNSLWSFRSPYFTKPRSRKIPG